MQLIAVEYNWGPPVSGRWDVDFLHLWAAARAQPCTIMVFLHGERSDGSWSLDLPLTRLEAFTSPTGVAYDFFGLSLRAQHEFPRQFVLRAEREDGQVAFANNQERNYVIQPYSGRGLSAVRKAEVIYDLGQIVPCQLFRAD